MLLSNRLTDGTPTVPKNSVHGLVGGKIGSYDSPPRSMADISLQRFVVCLVDFFTLFVDYYFYEVIFKLMIL